MDQRVRDSLEQLRKLHEKHLKLGELLYKAGGGSLYPLDFLAVAALNRSLCLITGFCTLIEARNFVAAAPLVRLQLDNCLRFSASGLVDDPQQFAIKVIEGVSTRKQKDRAGKRMTDRYLVDNLAEKNPWIPALYGNASGYVHLSEKHIFNALQAEDEELVFTLKIGDQDQFIPNGIYLEAIGAFYALTFLLLKLVYSWVYTKDNLEIDPEELNRLLGQE